jgi:hypothetical protein
MVAKSSRSDEDGRNEAIEVTLRLRLDRKSTERMRHSRHSDDLPMMSGLQWRADGSQKTTNESS